MMLQPVFSIWILVAIVAISVGFCIWQYVSMKDRSAKIAWIRRTGIVLLLGLAAIGPSVPGGYSPAGMLNLDVIFVVDITTSMAAEDYNGTQQRLQGVKQDILSLSDKMIGARFSIIGFDSTSQVLLPMTADRSSLDTIVSAIAREDSVKSRGSSIDQPIDAIMTQLVTNKKQNPQRPDLVFYMGDGEQTVVASPKSFAALSPYVSGGAVLGYGTTSGGKMKNYYGFGDGTQCEALALNCYVQDYSNLNFLPAISKANPTNLKNIADQMKITYVDRNGGGDISRAFKETNVTRIADSTRQVTHYNNLYFILAMPLLVLLSWEMMYLVRRYRETTEKREVHHG